MHTTEEEEAISASTMCRPFGAFLFPVEKKKTKGEEEEVKYLFPSNRLTPHYYTATMRRITKRASELDKEEILF